nr:TMEM175 family protein [Rhodoferax sp.]
MPENVEQDSVSANRLETFCDGVIAIAITLLVLEIKVPNLHESSANQLLERLQALWPILLATVLSFVIIGCYWVNHHQLMRWFRSINHGFVLLTLLWLLCLCLIPFSTGVLGETMLQGDSIRVGAPAYLLGLALPAWVWAAGWHYGMVHSLVSPDIPTSVQDKFKRMFYLSAMAHIVWVFLSLYAPWLALGFGTLQAMSYLKPLPSLAVEPLRSPSF